MSIFKYKAVSQKQSGTRKRPQISSRSGSFPLRLGAIDGKHINTQPPAHGGSTFCYYKCRFSMQIMAVDAAYQFRHVSVEGGTGQCLSDAGIFQHHSQTLRALSKDLNFPSAKPLLGSNYSSPILIFGKRFILSPTFPFCQMDHDQQVFTSWARQAAEEVFGIFANLWSLPHHNSAELMMAPHSQAHLSHIDEEQWWSHNTTCRFRAITLSFFFLPVYYFYLFIFNTNPSSQGSEDYYGMLIEGTRMVGALQPLHHRKD